MPGEMRENCLVMIKVNFELVFEEISEYWSPVVVGRLNGQLVKAVKMKGAFFWHRHDREDEMFMVLKGRFVMGLRDGDVELEEGEFLVVPKGVEHRPVAEEECWVVLFEPEELVREGD